MKLYPLEMLLYMRCQIAEGVLGSLRQDEVFSRIIFQLAPMK